MLTRCVALLSLSLFLIKTSAAQCPGALECESAETFCSLNHLNGFQCQTSIPPNSGFPKANLCFGVGIPHNLNWWAFVGAGGILNLTFNINRSQCENQQGIQAGVLEATCDGSKVYDCNASCNTSTFSLSGATNRCEIYYLWVDGCNGDVCNFTVSVNGNLNTPTLPEIDSFGIAGFQCPCSELSICASTKQGCASSYQWLVDGKPQNDDKCIEYTIPDSTLPGTIIDICLVATIGNPNHPQSICDQKIHCETITVGEIEKDTLSCGVLCHESIPYNWHGVQINSTCISPPCSTRIQPVPGACCVDAYKSWIVLPPRQMGQKDTFICRRGAPFLAENNQLFVTEVCDEIISWQSPITDSRCIDSTLMCDTSYRLNIIRMDYESNWHSSCDSCSHRLRLSNQVNYQTSCENFKDSVDIQLVWYNRDSSIIIDTTGADSFILVDMPGTYCVDVIGHFRQTTCMAQTPSCFTITRHQLQTPQKFNGPNKVYKEMSSEFNIDSFDFICHLEWSINGQGSILGNPDTSTITVVWDSLALDTTEICVFLQTDCAEYTLCQEVFICPETSSIDRFSSAQWFYSQWDQTFNWSDFPNQFTLVVYDVGGKMIKHVKQTSHGTMPLTDLSPGVYFFHAFYKNQKITKPLKVVVSR